MSAVRSTRMGARVGGTKKTRKKLAIQDAAKHGRRPGKVARVKRPNPGNEKEKFTQENHSRSKEEAKGGRKCRKKRKKGCKSKRWEGKGGGGRSPEEKGLAFGLGQKADPTPTGEKARKTNRKVEKESLQKKGKKKKRKRKDFGTTHRTVGWRGGRNTPETITVNGRGGA